MVSLARTKKPPENEKQFPSQVTIYFPPARKIIVQNKNCTILKI